MTDLKINNKTYKTIYPRVIPRDLFNEGNLFKCFAKLWLELDRHGLSGHVMYRNDKPFISL